MPWVMSLHLGYNNSLSGPSTTSRYIFSFHLIFSIGIIPRGGCTVVCQVLAIDVVCRTHKVQGTFTHPFSRRNQVSLNCTFSNLHTLSILIRIFVLEYFFDLRNIVRLGHFQIFIGKIIILRNAINPASLKHFINFIMQLADGICCIRNLMKIHDTSHFTL